MSYDSIEEIQVQDDKKDHKEQKDYKGGRTHKQKKKLM